MVRVIAICVTILVVTLLLLGAFQKDNNLPEPVTTTKTKIIKEHFEEKKTFPADDFKEDSPVRVGTYEFDIDRSVFNLKIEYNRDTDLFTVTNISDLASRLQTITTDTPVRVYYKNEFEAGKYWGTELSHLYYSKYGRRIFKGFWITFSFGLYISPETYNGMAGIGIKKTW